MPLMNSDEPKPEAITNPTVLYDFDDSLTFELPGAGEVYPDCQTWAMDGHREGSKAHVVRHRKSCHRRTCPKCYPDWIRRESLSVYDRISAYYDQTGRRPVHYVFSRPQSVIYDNITSFRELRLQAYSIGKLRAIKGGVMFFHQRSDRTSARSYLKAHCTKGPHFHVLGDGWLVENIKEFFLADGWIVKNLRVRSTGQVVGTIRYIMDHLAIPIVGSPVPIADPTHPGYPAISQSTQRRLASVTWFGTMSYNKLRVPKWKGSGTKYCPICELDIPLTDWFRLHWIPSEDPPDLDYWEAEIGNTGVGFLGSLTSWY